MREPVKLQVANLVKIFGSSAQQALKHVREGRDRDLIQEQTGNLVAVADISFDVLPGEIFVVMGLSGSGKSTLIRCLNRLIEPTAGSVLLDGDDLTRMSQRELIAV